MPNNQGKFPRRHKKKPRSFVGGAESGYHQVKIAPAPSFKCNFETGVNTATLYTSHYDRMKAVVAAARTGDRLLIKWSLEFHDKHGFSDVDDDGNKKLQTNWVTLP